MCLPDSCRHIIETIDILPEKERTVDYVRQKLIERKQLGAVTESVQTSPAGTNNTQAFKAQVGVRNLKKPEKEFLCYQCNKPGHLQRDCHSNFRGNQYKNYS
ncbi:unnamed protein product [Arctia plantaginis]|uniref:CCHC-type domain-containing protein n=1 Tax=Arctia plantaginis TaxID=874455 RepID=A0A8S1BRP0_ARCPL|nr:unnamed protein product [Arctia plantaginis]